MSIFRQIFKHKDTFFHGIGKKVSLLKIPRITIHGGNIDLVIDYVEHLRPDLILERFVSQSPRELLIAPDWGLKNHEFTDRVKKRMKERDAWQGKAYRKADGHKNS